MSERRKNGEYTPDGAGKVESGQEMSVKPLWVSHYQYNLPYPTESGAIVPMKQE